MSNIDHIAESLDAAMIELNEAVSRQNVLKKERQTVKFKDAPDVVIAFHFSPYSRKRADNR